jgi:two-component system cell cycle sensor histidine kinase/response regulator CckA
MPSGGLISINTENIEVTEEMCKNIESAQPGKFICLSIQDTGRGMLEETIEHIFDPFFSTKDPDNGKGLGMSVVYGIIKQHKGWVNVESIPGHGTTFKVYLHALPVELEKIDITEIKDIRTAGKGETILVVEDEEGVREFLNKTLSHVGYSVFVAEDSKQGFEIFKREKGDIQLVLSDVILPGINGVELVEKLLKQKPDLRVLLCSGDSDNKCLWSEIEEKGYYFLDKPFNIAMLVNKVHEAINN